MAVINPPGDPMIKIVVIYHSGSGHTASLARAVFRGVQSVAGQENARLVAVEEWEAHADEVDAADGIIFGAPTYMGSLSAPMKAFMDSTSQRWLQQAWRDKIAAGFTNSSGMSGDKLNSLIQLAVFAAQHGMVWVGTGMLAGNNHSKGSPEDPNRLASFLGVMAQSNLDEGPAVAPPSSDLRTGEMFGKRVALATQQWVLGRQHLHEQT